MNNILCGQNILIEFYCIWYNVNVRAKAVIKTVDGSFVTFGV